MQIGIHDIVIEIDSQLFFESDSSVLGRINRSWYGNHSWYPDVARLPAQH